MADVLIIDDDKAMCRMLSQMVERIGHKAAQKHTLTEGVEEALGKPYDVVFLDVRLPDGSGL